MTPLFKKLNFKGHSTVYLLSAPSSFEKEMKAMEPFTTIKTSARDAAEIDFLLIFATTNAEVAAGVKVIADKVKGDGVVYFAYPKGTSKKYKSEINRDNGWKPLFDMGYDTVRAVAIDEDWSGLRFRRNEFIKR